MTLNCVLRILNGVLKFLFDGGSGFMAAQITWSSPTPHCYVSGSVGVLSTDIGVRGISAMILVSVERKLSYDTYTKLLNYNVKLCRCEKQTNDKSEVRFDNRKALPNNI
jgi:hypothetical protein